MTEFYSLELYNSLFRIILSSNKYNRYYRDVNINCVLPTAFIFQLNISF